jgi:hypothetical protein
MFTLHNMIYIFISKAAPCASTRAFPYKISMSFVPATFFAYSTLGSGRAVLQRRSGKTATLPNGKEIDNHWIVSYNMYFLLKCMHVISMS